MRTYSSTLSDGERKTGSRAQSFKPRRMHTFSSSLFYLLFDTKNPRLRLRGTVPTRSKVVNMDAFLSLLDAVSALQYHGNKTSLPREHISARDVQDPDQVFGSRVPTDQYTVYAPDSPTLRIATSFLTHDAEEDKRISTRQLLRSVPMLIESSRSFFYLVQTLPPLVKQLVFMFASDFIDVQSLRRLYHALKLNPCPPKNHQ